MAQTDREAVLVAQVLRLVILWALLGLAASSAVSPSVSASYRAAFWVHLAFYGVALTGLRSPVLDSEAAG